mgnify:CR=1 FL=1
MSFFFSRSRKTRKPVQPVQRLCGLCFAMFVLFQTPLFTMPVEKEGGRVADVPMSAAEVAAIGVLAYSPDYAQATQLALVPGGAWAGWVWVAGMLPKVVGATQRRTMWC